MRFKYLTLGPGARKKLSVIGSHTTQIPFNVLSRTKTFQFRYILLFLVKQGFLILFE